jgi:2,3-bisphosphoglycerate-independent phosphoglycerate mutase
MKNQVILVIRDGWGISEKKEGNAILSAKTPNTDKILKKYPCCMLSASGLDVGLPEGYQGSSEVGHMNIGAGRVVWQELKRIQDSLTDGSFFNNKNFQKLVENWKGGHGFHLMGLVQDEGVHAHEEHLCKILEYLNKNAKGKDGKVYVHFFADGRDTPPRSALEYLAKLEGKIKKLKIKAEIVTIMGRYYSMDRGKNWKLTDWAYRVMVYPQQAIKSKEARSVKSTKEAIEISYKEDRTKDGGEMRDEEIFPAVIGNYSGIKKGDSVLHFNYRQDRAEQLTRAFVESSYPGKIDKIEVLYMGFTRYYDELNNYIMRPINEEGMDNLFCEVASKAGVKQLRIAETQKYKHVTSFFDGKRTTPFSDKEVWKEIKNETDQAELAFTPEMKAEEVTNEVIKELPNYDVVIVNFANCDMIGHTGIMDATIKAVEKIDECVGRITKEALNQKNKNSIVFITADHGNAEEMLDEHGGVKTSHTTNKVEFLYVAKDYKKIKLRDGRLCDIMPTMCEILGIKYELKDTPEKEQGRSLIV